MKTRKISLSCLMISFLFACGIILFFSKPMIGLAAEITEEQETLEDVSKEENSNESLLIEEGAAEESAQETKVEDEEAPQLTKKEIRAAKAKELIAYAKKFLGNPYRYGGTSLKNGTDCSGFTMGVFAKFGISLPHSSRSQAKGGTKIALKNMEPGDLLFYGYGSYITHVAIYIGNGKIIHAATSRKGICIGSASYSKPVKCVRYL